LPRTRQLLRLRLRERPLLLKLPRAHRLHYRPQLQLLRPPSLPPLQHLSSPVQTSPFDRLRAGLRRRREAGKIGDEHECRFNHNLLHWRTL
jgi:hypothetical protein